MPVGSSFTSNITRDQLITDAYLTIGVLADGENLPSSLQTIAIRRLNAIIRELDATGKWLWAIPSTPSTITLVANTWVYTSSNGLPTNMKELVTAYYRDPQANDWQLDLLTTEGYEKIRNKLDIGDPKQVYLTEHRDVGSQTLFVWPSLASVNTQSVVTGTDANPYKCIRSHTSDSTSQPITGANYLQYWDSGGSGAVAWVTAPSYTAPQLLRLWFKRPLFDFTASTDNPDVPAQWQRLLMYRLAADVGPIHRIGLDEQQVLALRAKGAYEDIFRSIKPVTTDYHDKWSYL